MIGRVVSRRLLITCELLGIDLPHDSPPLVTVELVDVQLAVQVVGLVLEAPGQLAGSDTTTCSCWRLIPPRWRGLPCAAWHYAGNGQAALGAVGLASQLDESWG